MSSLKIYSLFVKQQLKFISIPIRFSNTLPNATIEKTRVSKLAHDKIIVEKEILPQAPKKYKEIYPEYLPNPDRRKRDYLCEKLERMDMLRRHSVSPIPEFYVGTIMAVTVLDSHSPASDNRFLGLCIQKTGHGLRSNFTLRNIVDGQGVEITYDLYCPLIIKYEIIKLEKRLDNELFYLRDSPKDYSTFPMDMKSYQLPPNALVPINNLKVKLNPKPWHERWERKNLQGIKDLELDQKFIDRANKPQVAKPWDKYDIMKQYRDKINDPETEEIMAKVFKEVQNIENLKNLNKLKNKVGIKAELTK